MFKYSWCWILLSAHVFFLLTGCSSTKKDGLPPDFYTFRADKIPDPIPKNEPKSRYGNPPSYVALGKRYYVLPSAAGYKEKGIASWYGTKFHQARTSSGEPYDMYQLTAAHKTLPIPTYARVTNLQNGKTTIVRINDRGPFAPNRIIDLSFAAAKKIGVTGRGTAYVEVEAFDKKHPEVISPVVPPAYYQAHKPQLYLQIGAFSLRSSAETLSQQIQPLTAKRLHIVNNSQGQKILYKVQIGPLSNVEEADALTDLLEKKGLGSAFAVVR